MNQLLWTRVEKHSFPQCWILGIAIK